MLMEEGVSHEIELLRQDSQLLKISLKDRTPPLIVLCRCVQGDSADLTLCVSYESKEPSLAKNHGVFTDVS